MDAYYDATGTDQHVYNWFAQAGASPAGGTITFDPSNASVTHAAWSVVEFLGVWQGHINTVIRQMVLDPTTYPAGTATSRTANMASFNGGSATYAISSSEIAAVTIDADMSSLHSLDQQGGLDTFWKDSEDAVVSISHANGRSALAAFEILADLPPPFPLDHRTHVRM
jgi:hypothetical protein